MVGGGVWGCVDVNILGLGCALGICTSRCSPLDGMWRSDPDCCPPRGRNTGWGVEHPALDMCTPVFMAPWLPPPRRRLKLQALERHARRDLEREACSRQETYGRFSLAGQGYWCQKQLQGVARSLAQWTRQLSLECEWRDRVLREERQRWVALGVSRVREAEAIGRRGLLTAAMGGLGLLQAFVRGKRLILQHATAHVNVMAEAQLEPFRCVPPGTSDTWRPEAGCTSQRRRLSCTACCLIVLPNARL